MAQVLKRESISVVIDSYQDKQTGQTKHKRRTIGELVTMQGDDGSVYQFGDIWGPHGSTKFNVYQKQDDNQQQAAPQYQQPQHAAPQQHAAPPQGYPAGQPMPQGVQYAPPGFQKPSR